MNIWHDINKKRVTPENFIAIIEISKGSKNKYELDKETGTLKLDRILYTSTHYPQNYGFIPRTFAEDKDPLDVLVLCTESIIPMTLVECYPIGVVEMIDEGEKDEKIIAICKNDPMYNQIHEMDELPKHMYDEVKHFFQVYKTLEGKDTVVEDIKGKKEAIQRIEKSIRKYEEIFVKKKRN